ncbi:MAG: hypothetical protein IKK70_03070 [Clostridia bacterium]|nr:hypothetical protein [Clostridia bacterium]
MNVLAVCGFAVASAMAISLIRQLRPELASLASAIAGVALLVAVIDSLAPFIAYVKGIAAEQGIESYFAVMLKALAISCACRMSADICRDCGEASLASRVELAGKAGIVLLSLPIITSLLELAKDMLG